MFDVITPSRPPRHRLCFIPTPQQPFVIHDMETFQQAEKTLAAHMVNGSDPEPETGRHPTAAGCGELRQREAEARLFHCCQSTSVETVTELTEFAKAVPGFQSLDLNDQVGQGPRLPQGTGSSSCFSYLICFVSSLGHPAEVWRV